MKNIALNLVFLGLIVLLPCSLSLADTLILKSGKVVEGKILERNKDYVKIECDSQPLYYEYQYIQQINEEPIEPEETVVVEQPIIAREWSKAIVEEKKPKAQDDKIKAVIFTNVSQGFSPLKIVFNGSYSYSLAGKIVSYHWDFGDGDTASTPKAKNTYFSMSYDPRIYTVKLTVQDSKGNVDTVQTNISVTNKDLQFSAH